MIYVIGNMNGHVKIGITSGHLKVRLHAIQNGNPLKLSVLKSWELPSKADDVRAEAQLHKQLRRYRESGEWFFLSPWGLQWLLDRDLHDFEKDPDGNEPRVMHFKDTPLMQDVRPPRRPTMDQYIARMSDETRAEWEANEWKEDTFYWCQLTIDTAYDLAMSYTSQE